MNIYFEEANLNHIDLIFKWLAEHHMMEFWDNSQEHKDDILNFIHGRKQHRFAGTTKYWIGSIDRPLSKLAPVRAVQGDTEDRTGAYSSVREDSSTGSTQQWPTGVEFPKRSNEPYCFLLSDILQPEEDLSDIHRNHMSTSGHTIAIDFGIGNTKYLGKGLAAPTLRAFINFYRESIDPLADTFFIDPNQNNIRAKHVYSKAGFEQVGEFNVQNGAFKGNVSYLMVRRVL
jgi:RPE1 domain-containing protein